VALEGSVVREIQIQVQVETAVLDLVLALLDQQVLQEQLVTQEPEER
jgi:hypothetical protein